MYVKKTLKNVIKEKKIEKKNCRKTKKSKLESTNLNGILTSVFCMDACHVRTLCRKANIFISASHRPLVQSTRTQHLKLIYSRKTRIIQIIAMLANQSDNFEI